MNFSRRREDRLPSRILGFFKWIFVTIGAGTFILSILLIAALNKAVHEAPLLLPDNMILTYTFKSGLSEKIGRLPLGQPLFRPMTTFHDVIDGLTRAAGDPRVKGFVARIQDIDMTPAQVQELRDGIMKFRSSGKFAAVFTEDFGGIGSGMKDYYLASSFEQVWLQPAGSVSINGVSAEVPFFKDALDKLGVQADFSRKGVYKSATESLTKTGMSPENREMMTGMVNDISSQFTAGMAESRKLDIAEMTRSINGSPYTGQEALKLKLVDRLGYYDQMTEDFKTRAGSGAELVGLSGYAFKTKPGLGIVGTFSGAGGNNPKIALIIGSGDIVSGGGHSGFGESGMSADRISSAFEDAGKDPDIAAIVFRIDSPGGSSSASETIRRAVLKAQEKGKPVIVSMGGYAASGGYWVASPADKIVAEPGTITGSIGVFGGKFVLAELWEKIGVNWDGVHAGDNARMWSFNTPFSEKEKERFEFILNDIYESFITRVMEGRKMTREQVAAVAEGRVWTGRQAKERGLVDELGGLDKAVEIAKTAAGLPPDLEVATEKFPAQKSPLEMFIDLTMEDAVHVYAKDMFDGLKASAIRETEVLKAPVLKFGFW